MFLNRSLLHNTNIKPNKINIAKMLLRDPVRKITETAPIMYAILIAVLINPLCSFNPNAKRTAKQPYAIRAPMSLVLIFAPDSISSFVSIPVLKSKQQTMHTIAVTANNLIANLIDFSFSQI